jgi:FkbM family methyltransferase
MRTRLPRLVRKLPYYVLSTAALGRIATFRSMIRCAVARRKQLNLRDGRSFRLSAVVDLLVLKETLVDDVYGLGALDTDDGIIVDVGAGIGDFTLAAATRFPLMRVHAFEPNPEAFQLLQINVRRQAAENVDASQVAIGTERTYVLRRTSAGPRASVAVAGADDDAVVVPARRLDDALPQETVRLLKIDCEGLELAVLQSAAGVLDRVERVVVEYHRHLLPQADRMVAEFLREHGFRSWIRPDTYDEAIGYVHASATRVARTNP